LRQQPLLGYALAIEGVSDGQEVIVMPAAPTAVVDNLCMADSNIGISGAPVPGFRAHRLRPSDWNSAKTQQPKESKLSVADAAHRYRDGRKRLAGDGEPS
jgi:hypothetical protein